MIEELAIHIDQMEHLLERYNKGEISCWELAKLMRGRCELVLMYEPVGGVQ